ncbi:MAG: ribonuclease P protein component [Anaerolineaceae bacterium]
MKREFRLTRSTDFERVRRLGKSYAHPLVVLIVCPNENGDLRIGIAAGKTVGGAVERNRAKRQMRAAADIFLCHLKPGWDVVLLARKPIHGAEFSEIQAAFAIVFRRAHLLEESHDLAI